MQGVGYEVDVPMSTFYNLPATGEQVVAASRTSSCARTRICCSASAAKPSARAFRQLLKISGVGARTALSVLSGLSVAELAQAVTMQDTGRLTKIPGIGKKTAERLLLELKDKLAADVTTGRRRPSRTAGLVSDVLNALARAGYSDKEAVAAVKKLPDGLAVADGIRQALKLLAKA